MSRRRTWTRACARTGCPERSHVEYTARRELAGIPTTWLCRKHDKPDENMTPDNREITTVLELHPRYTTRQRYDGTLGQYTNTPELLGLFWGPENDPARAFNGIVSGPGFGAEGGTFPPGTRLIVTARIELPTPVTEGAPC
ncbi:hypothetical protein [Streptomyces sp. NPDC046371]|uniref:hypothetical protein n=1 Tax=Streptomyces sp. NPDC046371 TaxID=3154916 RepID=UPI0033CF3F2C